MKKLKKIVFFLLLLLGNIIFAQQSFTKKIKLNWDDNIDFEVSSKQTIKTCLVKGGFLNEDLNPDYSEVWNVANGASLVKFSIKNVVYEELSTNLAQPYSPELIKSELDADLEIANQRNETVAVLTLMPIVKEGNTIKKVISFDLEYEISTLKNKLSNKSSVKNSVLASGEWYKFSIDTTGIYRIDRDFLQNLGVDVNSINPKNIQIYGNGGAMLPSKNSEFRYDGLQQNAIIVNGEGDNSFDNGDFILFYAQGPHKWINNGGSLSSLQHQFNIFSEESFYYITVGSSEGLRIAQKEPVMDNAISQITNFDDYTFFEEDEVNLFAIGQQWFGDDYSIENSQSYSIPFNNIDSSEDLIVRVRGVAQSSVNSQMEVRINGENLFNVNYSAYSGLTRAYANMNQGELKFEGNSVPIEIIYNNNGNPSASAYLDYIEVLGKKNLVANGNQFSFRNLDIINSNDVYEFAVENSSNIYQVWDVSNPIRPSLIQNEASSSSFNFKVLGGVSHEFIVLNENDYYTPANLEESKVDNQDLHSLTNLDYIIVTRDYLVDQAQKIADYHIENSNLKVQVIPLGQIYNEFSSGSPDLTAIRDFARHLYLNSTTNQLKYICLFGDASYDYKDRIGGNNNIVPVYEAYSSFNLASSYVTDDYYGMMDENEGDMNSYERQDIATGRIPVTDPLEARNVIEKILNYYSSDAFGAWRNHITLVADDLDRAGEEIIQLKMEELADTILVNKPIFNLKKIYADAYIQEISSGGERYPTVNLDIVNQIESGTLLVDYFGHGGENGWAEERIFQVSEIQDLSNSFQLPLFVTITCDFTRFDNPLRQTAGEFLIWNKSGGAVSSISTTREIFISVGQAFNDRLIRPLLNFNDEDYTISESLMSTKNLFSTSQRFFIYSFGDPAMRLAQAKPNIRITKMNDVDITQSLDTIKALSYTKFEGEITNNAGVILTDFNGEFEMIVYDKPISKETLDNDNRNFVMEFDVLESKIFTGRSKVENGKFIFDFVAPKDLKVAYGMGKMSFYASNNVIDKTGYNLDVVVGGINEDAPEDNVGPSVQLYLNDLNFVDGGNTNESPVFIAVLEDESGINTSITAVDHDIVAILDGDQSNPIILNDFYKTELDNYKKGKVTYPLRKLSVGMHTITLKVWDTYNNISESTFTFFVVDNSDLILSNVLNYPNPFINYTEFWFNHNKPNQLLNVHIQIFTVSGKLVKSISETVQSEGNLVRSINWNGLDDFGSRIGKGVYVYKLKVNTIESNISAEKIEKLVILQ